MAGMFYSLEEAAEKLGLTQEDVKKLAAEGKLREFRDGANMMFKVAEVDALMEVSDAQGPPSVTSEPEGAVEIDETEDLLDLASIDEGLEAGDISDDILLESLDETGSAEAVSEEQTPKPAAEGSEAGDASDDFVLESLDETGSVEAVDEEAPLTLEPEFETAETVEDMDEDLDALLGFVEEEEKKTPEPIQENADEDDLNLVESELDVGEAAEAQDVQDVDLADTQLVSDASGELNKEALDTGASDLTDMDTTLAGEEGVSVLGETDGDFKLTDDTMAETLAGLGASGETSLEEIEDDMSLDSIGSGSGLLDLSLQADDTSLGGILDEIYTTEGGDAEAAQENVGTTEEVVAESETLPVESGVEAEEEFVPTAMPMTSIGAAADMPADASSRMLGGLLFIPIFILMYTGVIAISGMMGNTPLILSGIQSFIWYVLGGLAMLAVILSVVGLTKGDGSAKPAKAKKAKKEKASKKAKAEKTPKAQAPKAKKEKKPLFGKKKKK